LIDTHGMFVKKLVRKYNLASFLVWILLLKLITVTRLSLFSFCKSITYMRKMVKIY